MSDKLKGKVAIVTGASSGIGEATALALAAEGASVAIAARRSDRLETLASRITEKGGQVLTITADVADEAQVNDMVQQTHAKFGRVDILVNNAGVMLLGPIEGANTEDWRRMINVNVLGLMYATHAVLPLMKAQGIGHIVNISSVAGRIASANTGVYNATKWAVGAFSESLRKEVYQSNIRVTIIEPGLVATELPQHITNPMAKEAALGFYGSVKNLDSEDIAAAIAYAVTQPPHVNVNEILIRPTEQER
ncbi:SDR family NAD(P)-dependent oxidoreductase [Oscillatoria sp. FACHB-1407]|uniref:SDR family NAD(P)-dependent oxidoreductase n=1 Tax=Oscillatoria sp. FACHB-1407 TaxID=2692847 RepID=UPI0016852F87|nr:SDR family NAD(P)-dependent oxidoreductase [Oscillatoria sp. FACHB-1407]MBD2464526.1 SDR family NAD(P)-dependent oxidoreductase [Oscillatoria sp. FACHB-1407]